MYRVGVLLSNLCSLQRSSRPVAAAESFYRRAAARKTATVEANDGARRRSELDRYVDLNIVYPTVCKSGFETVLRRRGALGLDKSFAIVGEANWCVFVIVEAAQKKGKVSTRSF